MYGAPRAHVIFSRNLITFVDLRWRASTARRATPAPARAHMLASGRSPLDSHPVSRALVSARVERLGGGFARRWAPAFSRRRARWGLLDRRGQGGGDGQPLPQLRAPDRVRASRAPATAHHAGYRVARQRQDHGHAPRAGESAGSEGGVRGERFRRAQHRRRARGARNERHIGERRRRERRGAHERVSVLHPRRRARDGGVADARRRLSRRRGRGFRRLPPHRDERTGRPHRDGRRPRQEVRQARARPPRQRRLRRRRRVRRRGRRFPPGNPRRRRRERRVGATAVRGWRRPPQQDRSARGRRRRRGSPPRGRSCASGPRTRGWWSACEGKRPSGDPGRRARAAAEGSDTTGTAPSDRSALPNRRRTAQSPRRALRSLRRRPFQANDPPLRRRRQRERFRFRLLRGRRALPRRVPTLGLVRRSLERRRPRQRVRHLRGGTRRVPTSTSPAFDAWRSNPRGKTRRREDARRPPLSARAASERPRRRPRRRPDSCSSDPASTPRRPSRDSARWRRTSRWKGSTTTRTTTTRTRTRTRIGTIRRGR